MKIASMRVLLIWLFAAFSYCVVEARGQSAQPAEPTQPAASGQSSKPRSSTSPARQGSESEGEKRFEIQCGRCHTPPEDLSPREARAVLRQMRVRAMISAEDERLILKYIAP